MEQVYTSKIDTWLGFVLLGAVALCVIVFVSSLRDGSVPAILTTLPILLIGAGLPIWLLISTRYTLSNSADRKSTRLNSSHVAISYAVFCLKKKKCTRRRSTPVGWLRATRRGWGW